MLLLPEHGFKCYLPVRSLLWECKIPNTLQKEAAYRLPYTIHRKQAFGKGQRYSSFQFCFHMEEEFPSQKRICMIKQVGKVFLAKTQVSA